MFVKITLFKTDFDEENIFIPTNTEMPFFDFQPKMEDRLSLLKSKYEYLELAKSSYNPSEPFRIAKNAFDIKGVYNYAVFDFDTEKGKNENTPINKFRYYFIRDIVFVNDNVSQLIVKEDILPRVYNYLDIKQCLPESYTYKKSRIKKRDYKILVNDNMYKALKSFSGAITYTFSEPYYETETYQLFFLIVTCLSDDTSYGYFENGVGYPFINLILPIIYNLTYDFIEDSDFSYKMIGENDYKNAKGITAFNALPYVSNAGFKIVGTCITSQLSCVSDFRVDSTGHGFITFLKTNYGDTVSDANLDFRHSSSGPVIKFSKGYMNVDNFIDLSDDFYFDFFDEYGKIGYKKITFSCAQTQQDIDPILFLRKTKFIDISKPDKIIFRQSFVPPYNVYLGFNNRKYDESENLLYYEKYGITLSNTLSAGTYTDNYTEFLRTNYNSTVTGLAVQQSASRDVLSAQQNLEETKYMLSAPQKAISSIMGVVAGGLIGGVVGAGMMVGSGLSGAITPVTDLIGLQKSQQTARETLSINQEKENALLSLKISDIKNTPDTASFYGSIGDCVKHGKYPRITFWENVSLPIAKRGHKIFGFTLPQNINKIQSHYRFDYLRTKDLTLSFINGFSPTELERAEIEDTFNKGIRIWWTLDDYKNFDLENSEL